MFCVAVNVSDSVGQSTLYTVQVQVLQVNTAPTFTPSIGTANVPEGQVSQLSVYNISK